MATHPTHPARLAQSASAPASATIERGAGTLERWHAHRDAHKQARLISARNRRVLAKWLRRTANRAHDTDPIRRRREALLHYRAAAVRNDLLEIAALIEHARDPDPGCVAAIRDLLANGCDSPLYNADIHISELHATLHYIRSGL